MTLLHTENRPCFPKHGQSRIDPEKEIRSDAPTKPATDWLSAIRQAGHLYLPAPLPASTTDPDDEMFIECAVAARADYLVTGDKAHLLAMKQAGGVAIVAVSDFLRLLGLPENPA